MMALMKKLYDGSKFNDILRKWVWEDEDESVFSELTALLKTNLWVDNIRYKYRLIADERFYAYKTKE